MARLRVADVHLNVVEAGAGRPLVLLHGFTGSAAQWASHTTAFAPSCRTIAVDLLGHGNSDAPADPARYRMEHTVADLAMVLDQFDVEQVACLGYSMGGRAALAFALTYPKRVGALILEGGSPGIVDANERQARIEEDERLAESIERDGIDAFVDYWMQRPLFASQSRLGQAALTAARAARLANDPVGLANSLRGMGTGAQEPLWDRLPEISIPTLLIAGEEDEKFRGIATAMAARMTSAEVAVIPQAGHTTHLENPAEFQSRVLKFLKEVE